MGETQTVTHEVLRDFEEGRPLKVGEQVDAAKWKNLPYLEDQGFVRRLMPAERQAAAQPKRNGRASRGRATRPAPKKAAGRKAGQRKR